MESLNNSGPLDQFNRSDWQLKKKKRKEKRETGKYQCPSHLLGVNETFKFYEIFVSGVHKCV